MYTLNKHVRWREDNGKILICDCKRLTDLKIPLGFKKEIIEIESGVKENDIKGKLRSLFLDFKQLKLLSKLEIREIKDNEFKNAMKILDEEIKERVRDNDFLFKKYKEFSKFFIGVFLDDDIIGVICGFPREDYLLMSEIAIDPRFRRRGFGNKLVREFEKIGKKGGFKRINVGARDSAIEFYKSLNYDFFLLIQFKKEFYSIENFKNLDIRGSKMSGDYIIIEVNMDKLNLKVLENLRKEYPNASFQYIFTKMII